MGKRTALVVDDDATIRVTVVETLAREGFETVEATTGQEALEIFSRRDVDLVVLDNMMPGISGEEVCRRLRAKSGVPILFLSKFADDVDRIVGLEIGADDYIAKPFNPRELLARIRAVLRRAQSDRQNGGAPAPPTTEQSDDEISVGSLRLDLNGYDAYWNGERVGLTKTEFKVLRALARWPSRVYSRPELVERVYEDAVVSERTIDSHVRRVRRKFEEFDVNPIETVRGVGFQLRFQS